MLNVEALRADFPILQESVNGEPLIYLDNAATTQKPRQVIEAISHYYLHDNANVHRGVHSLSQRATELYEAVRHKVAALIQAPVAEAVIFTKGTTDAVNLVMSAWGRSQLKAGQNIVVSQAEHHSNLVPWQMLAAEKDLELRVLSLRPDGTLDLETGLDLIDEQTGLVAVQQMSNVLGTLHDVRRIIQAAHAQGSKVLIDAAQSAPHMPINVQELDCDFLALSAHKMLGPTGVGALYARPEILAAMPPYQGGGAMIKEVWDDHFTWGDLPYRFEAGTPNIAGVVGFGAALDYLAAIGPAKILEYEQLLTTYALEKMKQIEGLILYGPEDSRQRGGIVSFNFEGIHPRDVGEILDQQGIAIRTGHHCCQPMMRVYGVSGMARASVYLYNTHQEIDQLVAGLERVQRLFARASKRRHHERSHR